MANGYARNKRERKRPSVRRGNGVVKRLLAKKERLKELNGVGGVYVQRVVRRKHYGEAKNF